VCVCMRGVRLCADGHCPLPLSLAVNSANYNTAHKEQV
jgi:hypothetical protein